MPILSFVAVRSQRILLCVFTLFFVGGVPRAFAGPQAPDDGCLTEPTCKSHYNQAVSLFEAGRFETALPEFQAAYEQRQMPWLLINIGRTLHRLGRPKEALEYYDRYKHAEMKPDPETTERVDRYIAQAKALAETPTAPTTPPPPGSSSGAQEKPIYKKWWFWTAIGGGALAIIIIGAAAGASRGPHSLPTDGTPIYKPTF